MSIASVKITFLRTFMLLIIIVLFFGRNNLISENYFFGRILSPQFSGTLWLTFIYFLVTRSKSLQLETTRKNLAEISILIVLSSFIYIFAFLAIVGTLVFLSIANLFLKRYRVTLLIATIAFFSSVPLIVINLTRIGSTGFHDAALRMGLIESRVPGALKTTLMSSFLIIYIVFRSKIWRRFAYNIPLQQAIVLSSFGIIIACQSNIVTSLSIQFSDHFNVFVYLNYVILIFSEAVNLSRFFRLRPSATRKMKEIKSTSLVFLISFSIIGSSINFIDIMKTVQKGSSSDIQESIRAALSENKGVIVDSSILRKSFPVFANNQLLYHDSAFYYGFSNEEILRRYFVSKGCPSNLQFAEYESLMMYRKVASEQKAQSVIRVLRLFRTQNLFQFLYRDLQKYSEHVHKSMFQEYKKFLRDSKGLDCKELAKNLGVEIVIFDDGSNWHVHFEPIELKELKSTRKLFVASTK